MSILNQIWLSIDIFILNLTKDKRIYIVDIQCYKKIIENT